jgi:hypothetical protein
VISKLNLAETEPSKVRDEFLVWHPLSASIPPLRNFKNDSEIGQIALREEILDALDGVAWNEAAFALVSDAQVLEEKDVLFPEITVLQVTYDLGAVQNSEASELIGKVVLAVLNPVENLTLRILSFRQDRFPIDAQRGVEPGDRTVSSFNGFQFHRGHDNF